MPRKMQSRYEPKTADQVLGYLVEECGEVLAAAGKSQRWGLASSNPELPENERELNMYWLAREIDDLERAIAFVRSIIPPRCTYESDVTGARCLLPSLHRGTHQPASEKASP